MKHAGSEALDRLEPFLIELRKRRAMKEKKRGVFYYKEPFLHFHEHGKEFFADVKLEGYFVRLPATTDIDRKELLQKIDVALLQTPRGR